MLYVYVFGVELWPHLYRRGERRNQESRRQLMTGINPWVYKSTNPILDSGPLILVRQRRRSGRAAVAGWGGDTARRQLTHRQRSERQLMGQNYNGDIGSRVWRRPAVADPDRERRERWPVGGWARHRSLRWLASQSQGTAPGREGNSTEFISRNGRPLRALKIAQKLLLGPIRLQVGEKRGD